MASAVEFAEELAELQAILDSTNMQVRDAGGALAAERQKLEDLQAKIREKHELRQKIANLVRANAELKASLSPGNGQLANGVSENVAIGEADRGLDFDGRLSSIEQTLPTGEESVDPDGPLSSDQRALVSVLERAEVIHGRVKAYQQHNSHLENEAHSLKKMSQELEDRYRKIVSICTGAKVTTVDEMLDNLLQAVISEVEECAELGKVRDFLRMVQGTD
jgi:regulatory protein SWI6